VSRLVRHRGPVVTVPKHVATDTRKPATRERPFMEIREKPCGVEVIRYGTEKRRTARGWLPKKHRLGATSLTVEHSVGNRRR
jgi:hypothetical protein